jgi:5-methylthioadenosine/S-adenosylhomocysteine deaminase
LSLAVTGAITLEREVVALRAEDGAIAEIGAGVRPRPGDEVIDAGGMALVPGLVNGHTHAAMTLFRGYGDDMPLMEWLERRIWPAEARLEPDDVYWGTRLACVEMIRTGTVRFWDMYWHPDATARAVEDAGLRATIAAPLIERTGDGGATALRDDAERSLAELVRRGPAVEPALAPHAIYTVGEESLRWISAAAEEHGVPVHIHLSETRDEIESCLAEHGVRPAAYLDRLGLLGPRTLLAHGVWLDDDELDLIAERGATVVTNPVANMKLGVGRAFPYREARRRGVAVGLGTDGPGSNNSLDLFSEMKFCALIQKHAAGDPTVAPADEVWAAAIGGRAPLLGQPGRLAAHDPADFLLLRIDVPELAPGDLLAGLVYAASGSVVDTTVVGGRALMRSGVVEGAEEVIARAVERARRLGVA